MSKEKLYPTYPDTHFKGDRVFWIRVAEKGWMYFTESAHRALQKERQQIEKYNKGEL